MERRRYGVIGLGKMGGSLVRNLHTAGGHAVVYDVSPQNVADLVAEGATGTSDLAELARAIQPPRVIWIMVPAGEPVERVISDLEPCLTSGDVLIDGGNSHYKDSVRRAAALKEKGIYFMDSGTSGGMEGALNGLCLMVGGDREAFELAEPLFQVIAQPGGYGHVGPSGAGHYVKMVHNAIEYGMLQAIGEGFELLHAAPYDVDKVQVAELWNRGSVIRSWLVELAGRAFEKDPGLDGLTGSVGGGDTGSWAIDEAWRIGVPMTGIATAISLRLRSRQGDTFAGKVVAALRREFGGHSVVSRE